VRLIRPLLCLTRAQTEGYCQERGWQPLRDSSNQDTAFRRNRIRLELLPQLRSYNPRIVDVLCRLSEIMAAQTEYLDNEIQSKWMPAIRTVGPDELRIPRSIVREAPHAVRQGMIRLMISMLNPGLRDLAYRHVEQAIGFCLAPPETDHADLALGLEMAAEGEMIVFRKHRMEAGAMEWEGVTLPLPGKLHLRSPDMELEMEILPAGKVPLIQPRMSKWQACMDLDRLDLPLCVRSRRTGERWTPLGMEKTVNLANFLSAQHWPFSKRDHWPMVCDQTGIVWIPGVRMGEKARLKEKTERCLILHAKIVMEETS
jgi:tRNA(Ile)-lysidine synthase